MLSGLKLEPLWNVYPDLESLYRVGKSYTGSYVTMASRWRYKYYNYPSLHYYNSKSSKIIQERQAVFTYTLLPIVVEERPIFHWIACLMIANIRFGKNRYRIFVSHWWSCMGGRANDPTWRTPSCHLGTFTIENLIFLGWRLGTRV